MQNGPTRLDVSSTALINLKKQGVPDEVITAMVETASGKSTGAAMGKPAPNASNTPDVEIINNPYYYDKANGEAIDLERSTVKVKAKIGLGVLVPMAQTPMVFRLESPVSPVRIPSSNNVSFIMNCGNTNPDAFGLYRMAAGRKDREAVWLTVGGFKNKSDKDVIAFNYKKLKERIYEIMPLTSLAPGEYSFVNKISLGTYGGSKADVFAFGID
ncbi:MAG: hypothetical protein EOP48_25995 [Sphingobacteriales bacterium]|nr:MAG: hypothetical protein EOP48_25995 [Sphingobacteriales bacterium]